jgi:hypothetical protein
MARQVLSAYRPTYDSGVEPTDQLFDRHQFPMPTLTLKRHVVVDYGL